MYIGLDPGVSGGVAALDADGNARAVARMPETEADVLALLRSLSGRAVLEFVRAMPRQGVSSTFKFGMGYGGLRMALVAAGIPFDEVTPLKWQRALGCLSKGDKNVTKRRAQELFPGVRVTHAISDALLLAEYCRRWSLGLLHARAEPARPARASTDLF